MNAFEDRRADSTASSIGGSWWPALAVFAVALALRLPRLGHLGLGGDEDISTLAARGIAEFGWPRLPSGAVYWRAPLFHYLVAPLAATGVDWLPRLVSVAASAVTALLTVRLGSRWLGHRAAVVGGVLVSVSLVEVHLARQARFYALYQLLAMLALWCLYRFWQVGTPRWAWRSAGAVLLAMLAHQVGVTLAVLFLLAAVRLPALRYRVFAVLIVPVFVCVQRYQRWLIGSGFDEAGPRLSKGNALVDTPLPIAAGVDIFDGIGPVVLAGAFALVAGVLAWRGSRAQPWFSRGIAVLGLAATLAAAGGSRLGLSLCLMALLIAQRNELFPGSRGGRAILSASVLLPVAATTWAVIGLASGHGVVDVAYELFGRSLGRFFRYLVVWPPAIALPAILGTLMTLLRSWSGRARDGERFLVIAVVGLVAVRSLVAFKWSSRYLSDIRLLWELLAGWALVRAVLWVAHRWQGHGSRKAVVAVAATLAISAVAVLPGTGPAGVLAYIRREPGAPPRSVSRVVGFSTDYRGVVDWLEPRLQPGDRVAATDWLTTYCYLGRLDGWIRTRGYVTQAILVDGVARDRYVGAQVLPDIQAIRSLAASGPLWIVAGASELRDPGKLDPVVRDWLLDHEPLFVAADGETRVIRIGSSQERSP